MLRKRTRNLAAAVTMSVSAAMLTAVAMSVPAATAATVSGHVAASGSRSVHSAPAGSTAGDPTWIVNYNSGLCLGISGGEDDAPAVQWTCGAVSNQEWHQGAELGSTGYYQQINGDNECLGVAGESLSEGARVYGWTCNGHPDQYWAHDGDQFIDWNSSLLLGVAGGSTAVGAAVVQWPYTGALNQFWITTSTI